ncbi:histidinol-phosphate transaminase [Cognatilysobacter tabacisoli]|uniref:histidinol-phosphate transaminase n=1 Tax=Cognatilysobacter tabacisoli TaxID=2315424 RepID=UPI000E6B08A8|nr:histidinol-phosphate transaminase [Lysobacter tabacisoli]
MSAPVAGVIDLVREDLRAFGGYRSARSERVDGQVWLNANESPWANPADADATARRYPDPQPADLRAALAALYGCRPEQLLAGRGSDEGIDLLVRALCTPGQGAIVVTTPTFGMYAVVARVQAARVVDVPLDDGADGFTCDFDAVAEAAERAQARLVFLCSPGNPSGTALPLPRIAALARRLAGRAVVVVDEAYGEYASGPSAVTLLDAHDNIAVLRTLSKAHALAAARVGAVIAHAELIAVLQRCQAPYPLPQPCVALAMQALSPPSLATTRERIVTTIMERDALRVALSATPGVRRAYPSQANFVLARFDDAQAAWDALLASGVVIRDFRATPRLGDALRITIGTPEQNALVLETLRGVREAAA